MLWLFQTQIDEDAMCKSTRRYELIVQHVPDQPGSLTPGWYRHPWHLCLTQVHQKIYNTKRQRAPSSPNPRRKGIRLCAVVLSADSGDELNLRHLQLRDTVSARSQGRPHLIDELQQQGHQQPCRGTATAGLRSFALSDHTPVITQKRACRQPFRTAP